MSGWQATVGGREYWPFWKGVLVKPRRRRDSDFASLLSELFQPLSDVLSVDEQGGENRVREELRTLLPGDSPDDQGDPLKRWESAILRAMSLHRPKQARRGRRVGVRYCHVDVTSCGKVDAVLETTTGTYSITLRLNLDDDGRPDGGCNCAASRGVAFCIHTYACLRTMREMLDDPHSRLVHDILQFAADDEDDFELTLSDLDDLIAQVGRRAATSALPDAPLTRIMWEIQWDGEELFISSRIQRPKKRGDGWTKGALKNVAELRGSPELLTHAADRGVVAALYSAEPSFHRHPQYLLDMVEALLALAGHDRVRMNGEPATVQAVGLAFQLVPDSRGYRVRLWVPADDFGRLNVLCYSNGTVAVDEARRSIYVIPHDEVFSDFVMELLDQPMIPAAGLPQFVERFKRLGRYVGVLLPESEQGPVVPAETAFVLLLRSNPHGFMECGLRVNVGGNQHFLPGEGPMFFADTDGQRPVQRQRDAQAERTGAAELANELQLERAMELGPWTWRVLDIDDSLKLLERADELVATGRLEVAWDPESAQPVRVIGDITPQNLRVQLTRKRDWFGLEGICRTRSGELSLSELLEGLDGRRQGAYTEIRPGEFARISRELVEQLKKLRDVAHTSRKQLEVDPVAAPVVRELQQSVDIEAPRAWQECLARLKRAERLDPQPPESLRGTLREYQLEGYRWLRRLAEWGVGACLADDMGLGKTIQTLAVLLDRRACGPTLVIAPTSVGFNWVREAERFAPDLNAHLYRETERAEFLEGVGAGDLVVCSYGLALRDADALARVGWGTLVLDEAQFIKNAQTKTAKAIRQLSAGWKLALTGTPIENSLSELWSIFRTISPGLFGSWQAFRKKFAVPIERHEDPERRQALARLIRPFVLRRTKGEVLTELPDRTEMNLHVELSAEERKRYDQMRLAALGEIDQLAGLTDTSDQRFRILAILTRLRQLACHVGLVDPSWDGPSAKLELLLETVRELKAEGHRALIFSQFTSFLAKIRQAFDEAGIAYQYLDGSTSAAKRRQAVDSFQDGQSDVFLISLKAGGTGLNLTAADYVIHTDPWWNPAVEDQATDRAHRIGQTRSVMVYRLVAKDTIEEQILDLHREKRDLVDSIMDGSQAAAKLSTEELIALIRGSRVQ